MPVCRRRTSSVLLFFTLLGALAQAATERPTLESGAVRLAWTDSADGWQLTEVLVRGEDGVARSAGRPSGRYTLLYSATPPDTEPRQFTLPGRTDAFIEPTYIYNTRKWAEATAPVALNLAGEAHTFFPRVAARTEPATWTFREETPLAEVQAVWRIDPDYSGDIDVTLTLTAKRAGYFSLATPTLVTLDRSDLQWAVVPGYFQGNEINPNLPLALVYGHGLPDRPVLTRERATSTLASIMTHRSGITTAVAAEPGTAADPWANDRDTRVATWRLGLSHMNRAAELAPTLYHPVLGEDGSKMAAGEQRTFRFRYVLRQADWFTALKHVAADIYRLPDFLALKHTTRSLSDRMQALHRYVTNDETSLWRCEDYAGYRIGAQAYLGGIVGSDKDGMKNSDYGAMWMLARLTDDPRLVRDRLPFARNFKLAQQQREPGFFQGAALGQYYLSKSRRFTEEWGDYVEPVALTYYVLLDLGNILLFEPQDAELRERLRLAADRLMDWQHADGHWEVAYDHRTQQPLFTETPDYRPTFYGLLVAYRVLCDKKYLAAARRGADWLIAQGVARGRFLGVCGDNRFAPDFATAQISQALLDLHAVTGNNAYRDAAITTARFYVTSIFTHPQASAAAKTVRGTPRFDWEINQTGLGFEHGGAIGTAGGGGPILLATHAGWFIRLHALTGEPLFRDLARAAAWAREAFVNPETSVASYYWSSMDRGAGPFPHHAWWQIGWIIDYLLSEAELRSGGQISFPAGFITPKVGPHRCYGFAPGKIFGESAELAWGRIVCDQPAVDYIVARAKDARRIFVVLLNDSVHPLEARLQFSAGELTGGAAKRWTALTRVDGAASAKLPQVDGSVGVKMSASGWCVLALDY